MNILFLILCSIIMLVGLIGIFLPVLPGSGLVFAGALLYAWVTDFQVITIGNIIFFGILAALAWGIDYLAGIITAKKYGASKYGIIASLVLGIVGLIMFNIPGLIIGQFVGMLLGELYLGKEMKHAFKTGMAAFIGYLLGNTAKVALCSIIMVVFYYKVFTF